MKMILLSLTLIPGILFSGVTSVYIDQTDDGFIAHTYGLLPNGACKNIKITDVKLLNDIENCSSFNLKSNSLRTTIIFDDVGVNRTSFMVDGDNTEKTFAQPASTVQKKHISEALSSDEVSEKNQVKTKINTLKAFLESQP